MQTRKEFLGTLAGGLARGTGRKVRDVVIYSDERYYCAFPSVVRLKNGELVAAFRRAPDRRVWGNPNTHTDPNAYLVLVRSKDEGEHWTAEPELIHAHADGGSQDPCMVLLDDGTLLCASYLWQWLGPKPKLPAEELGNGFAFRGGYLMRSRDGGWSWQGPELAAPLPGELGRDRQGRPLPAYNRGAMCQGRSGRLFWAVASTVGGQPTTIHLVTSDDRGRTWRYACPIASDAKISFNETSLIETPKGELVAFARTEGFDDHTVVVRSVDGGKSFQRWEDTGFQGHPHHALRLEDGRVWLAYGYRHAPYGVRARVLDAECRTFGEEIVLRADGGGRDLGYPWSTRLSGGRVLTCYYMQKNDGPRRIEATIVEV